MEALHIEIRISTLNCIPKPKEYDLNFILQELGKFKFKINVIPNGLEMYMSF